MTQLKVARKLQIQVPRSQWRGSAVLFWGATAERVSRIEEPVRCFGFQSCSNCRQTGVAKS